jgi:cold-inducible RNA-binding protein
MRMYVGNLSYETTEDELRKAFEAFGSVVSVDVITDKYTGKSKGFAFVEMSSEEETKAAISGLNGQQLGDRILRVDEARPRREGRGGRDRGGFNNQRDEW